MITHHGIWAIAHMLSRSLQTFIHSWRTSTQTFVNSVSNKQCSWTHTLHRVQQTRRASLDQGANWFGAPATNARRVSEANRIFNRTNPPIVAKIKDCENCTHAKFARFSNNWQRFFPTHVCDTSCQSLTQAYRKLIKVGHSSRCMLTRSRSSKPPSPVKKTLAQFMTYEQLFICRLSNLPRSIVSIVLRKLAIVNTASRKQEWTLVHSIILNLIHQKFN